MTGLDVDRPAARYRVSRARFAVADELTCYYDRPAEAATVHMEVRVRGRLDQEAVRAAVRAVLDAEPGLRVRQEMTSRWLPGLHWEYRDAPDLDPVLTAKFADEGELDRLRSELLSQSPPLRVSPPLRFLIASGPGGDALILNAHHSRLDGLSCLRLLRRVADQYSASSGGRPPDSPRCRGACGCRLPSSQTSLVSPGGIAPRRRHISPVVKIARLTDEGTRAARGGYGVRLVTWDGLADAGWLKPAGISVNDLLIAAMMITVGDWNAEHGRRAGLVKITMPVGDRVQAGSNGLWANTSRLTSVTARVVPGQVAFDLLTDVAAQTRYAKEHGGPQVGFCGRTLAAAPIPVTIKDRVLRTALTIGGSFLCDTCLVSNLGVVEPVEFGLMAASHLWFSTFAHMPRGLSLGALTTGSVLHLAFRYRRALLSDQAATEFAGRYGEVLRRLASREAMP